MAIEQPTDVERLRHEMALDSHRPTSPHNLLARLRQYGVVQLLKLPCSNFDKGVDLARGVVSPLRRVPLIGGYPDLSHCAESFNRGHHDLPNLGSNEFDP